MVVPATGHQVRWVKGAYKKKPYLTKELDFYLN